MTDSLDLNDNAKAMHYISRQVEHYVGKELCNENHAIFEDVGLRYRKFMYLVVRFILIQEQGNLLLFE